MYKENLYLEIFFAVHIQINRLCFEAESSFLRKHKSSDRDPRKPHKNAVLSRPFDLRRLGMLPRHTPRQLPYRKRRAFRKARELWGRESSRVNNRSARASVALRRRNTVRALSHHHTRS